MWSSNQYKALLLCITRKTSQNVQQDYIISLLFCCFELYLYTVFHNDIPSNRSRDTLVQGHLTEYTGVEPLVNKILRNLWHFMSTSCHQLLMNYTGCGIYTKVYETCIFLMKQWCRNVYISNETMMYNIELIILVHAKHFNLYQVIANTLMTPPPPPPPNVSAILPIQVWILWLQALPFM